MTQKYNSRDAEVEPREYEEFDYEFPANVRVFTKIELDEKGDMVEAAMHEDNKEEGSNGMEV